MVDQGRLFLFINKNYRVDQSTLRYFLRTENK